MGGANGTRLRVADTFCVQLDLGCHQQMKLLNAIGILTCNLSVNDKGFIKWLQLKRTMIFSPPIYCQLCKPSLLSLRWRMLSVLAHPQVLVGSKPPGLFTAGRQNLFVGLRAWGNNVKLLFAYWRLGKIEPGNARIPIKRLSLVVFIPWWSSLFFYVGWPITLMTYWFINSKKSFVIVQISNQLGTDVPFLFWIFFFFIFFRAVPAASGSCRRFWLQSRYIMMV